MRFFAIGAVITAASATTLASNAHAAHVSTAPPGRCAQKRERWDEPLLDRSGGNVHTLEG
jgi:hypothetical protein